MVVRPLIVGAAGFEPATPCSQNRCANRTALRPDIHLAIDLFFFSRDISCPDIYPLIEFISCSSSKLATLVATLTPTA